MASTIYPKARELAMGLICGSGTRPTGTLKAALVDTGVYTYSTAHDYYDDVSAGVIGTPVAIGSATFTGGVLDGADVTWTSVPGTTSLEAVVVYLDTGTPGTSPLICFIDSGTGIPVTSNGGNITGTWNGSGICAL